VGRRRHLVGILVFANWAPGEDGLWMRVFAAKWLITAAFGLALLTILVRWFDLALWKAGAIGAATALAALAVPTHPPHER
jgi:hypothetical protein